MSKLKKGLASLCEIDQETTENLNNRFKIDSKAPRIGMNTRIKAVS